MKCSLDCLHCELPPEQCKGGGRRGCKHVFAEGANSAARRAEGKRTKFLPRSGGVDGKLITVASSYRVNRRRWKK